MDCPAQSPGQWDIIQHYISISQLLKRKPEGNVKAIEHIMLDQKLPLVKALSFHDLSLRLRIFA
jgi:hypothetical protein